MLPPLLKIRYSCEIAFPNMSKNFSIADWRLPIADWMADVKIMNLQALRHIIIWKNLNRKSAIENLKSIVEDIGFEPPPERLQSGRNDL